jgi:glycosyltransferase involved in cell wall biosynthesis
MAKRRGFDLDTLKKIRNSISQGVDVLHTHNVLPHYYATAASLGLKVRRISTRHDMGVHLKGKRMNFLYNLSLYKTHAVVAVCEAARSRFVGERIVPQNLISVIYNGIPAINTNPNGKTSDTRKKLSLPLEGPIVGSIGRLNVVKDYDTLIRAFAEVLKAYPTAKLVIAGNGPEKDNLQRLIDSLHVQENVVLLGERSDAEELLEQFDVFALTSLTEGFSVALVEAAWSGVPIVATDVGGNKEIVMDNETGFLVEPKNVHDIKTKIEALLSNDALRLTFGKTSRKHAEKHWTLELMRDRYKAAYLRNVKN